MISEPVNLCLRKILVDQSFEISKGKRKDEERLLVPVILRNEGSIFRISRNPDSSFVRMTDTIYFHKCIWIEMIRVCMRYIDRIDCLDFLSIKSYFRRAFHEISYSIIREPRIDEDSDIFSLIICDIDEEFGMSEGCDNHTMFLLGKMRKARLKNGKTTPFIEIVLFFVSSWQYLMTP